METPWFVLRIINVFLYGGVVSGLIMHWRSLRVESMPGFRWGIVGLVAAGAYATVEIVILDQPGGPRLVPLAASLAVLFVSCYLRPAQQVAQHFLAGVRMKRRPRR